MFFTYPEIAAVLLIVGERVGELVGATGALVGEPVGALSAKSTPSLHASESIVTTFSDSPTSSGSQVGSFLVQS